jgi:hypothetical protein
MGHNQSSCMTCAIKNQLISLANTTVVIERSAAPDELKVAMLKSAIELCAGGMSAMFAYQFEGMVNDVADTLRENEASSALCNQLAAVMVEDDCKEDFMKQSCKAYTH